MMVGRDVENAFPKVDVAIGDTVLEVRNYCHRTEFRDISFTLRRGEILGVYGLIGAGRSELCQSLFGITKPLSGKLTLEGQENRSSIRRTMPSAPASSMCRRSAAVTAWRCRCRSTRTCRCPRSAAPRARAS